VGPPTVLRGAELTENEVAAAAISVNPFFRAIRA
jgi:hypothetical protein